MFGLSIKEKLYKAIMRLTEEKLPVFEQKFAYLIENRSTMSDDAANDFYISCIGSYSDAVSGVLADTMGRTAAIKAGLAFQSPTIAGLPEELDMEHLLSTGPLVGYYFALYYYGITGKKISLDDYGKFIRPLNQYQVNLINSVISKYDS